MRNMRIMITMVICGETTVAVKYSGIRNRLSSMPIIVPMMMYIMPILNLNQWTESISISSLCFLVIKVSTLGGSSH